MPGRGLGLGNFLSRDAETLPTELDPLPPPHTTHHTHHSHHSHHSPAVPAVSLPRRPPCHVPAAMGSVLSRYIALTSLLPTDASSAHTKRADVHTNLVSPRPMWSGETLQRRHNSAPPGCDTGAGARAVPSPEGGRERERERGSRILSSRILAYR